MKVLLVSVKSEKTKGGITVWTNQYLAGWGKCEIVNTEIEGGVKR